MNISQPSCIKKFLSLFMLASMLNLSFVAVSYGDAISTQAIQASASIAEKRASIESALARDDVRAALVQRGVSPEDVDSRVAELTDAEVIAMHDQIDQLPAGEGFLGAVVALIVIFMLLDMAGVTDIFPSI